MLGLRSACLAVAALRWSARPVGERTDEPTGRRAPDRPRRAATYGSGRAINVYGSAREAALADTVILCPWLLVTGGLVAAEAIADRGA